MLLKYLSFEQRTEEWWDLVTWGVGGLRRGAEQCHGLCDGRLALLPCGLPWWLRCNESTCQCRRRGFDPWVKKIPWRRKCSPPQCSCLKKSHGHRSLVGYSPWGRRVGHNLATKQQQLLPCQGRVEAGGCREGLWQVPGGRRQEEGREADELKTGL